MIVILSNRLKDDVKIRKIECLAFSRLHTQRIYLGTYIRYLCRTESPLSIAKQIVNHRNKAYLERYVNSLRRGDIGMRYMNGLFYVSVVNICGKYYEFTCTNDVPGKSNVLSLVP